MSGHRAWRARRGPGRAVPSPHARRGLLRSETGQASVELIALVPLLVGITVAVAGFLAAHSAEQAADAAAVAGAIAQLQGGDPAAAAKAAAPGWTVAKVRADAGHVRVQVVPRGPGFITALIDAERRVATR